MDRILPSSSPSHEQLLPPPTRLYLKLIDLEDRCAACAGEFREWLARGREKEHDDGPELAALGPGDWDIRSWDHEIDALMGLSPVERLQKVQRSLKRLRSPALAAAFLRHARRHWHREPAVAKDLAEVGAAIARFAGGAPLRALAAAYQANANRALGALRTAAAEMAEARALAALTLIPARVAAELDCLEGSLLKDDRRLEGAAAMLTRSKLIFISLDDRAGQIRCEIKLAEIDRMVARHQQAIDRLCWTLTLATPRTSADVVLSILHSLAACLNEAGRHDEAQHVLEAIRPLQIDCSSHQRIRLFWLEGEVARASDQLQSAEAIFRDALVLAFDSEHILLASFMALELAAVLHQQGRRAELRALSAMLPPLFRAEGLEEEAAAAVYLLHETTAQDRLTFELIEQIRDRLEQAEPRSRRWQNLP